MMLLIMVQDSSKRIMPLLRKGSSGKKCEVPDFENSRGCVCGRGGLIIKEMESGSPSGM